MQVNLKLDNWIEVGELIFVILICPIQDKCDLVFIKLELVYQVRQGVTSFLFLFNHASNIGPIDPGALHHVDNINDGLDLEGVLLEDDGLVLGEVLLALQPGNTLFLVLPDPVHFFPDFIFLAGKL